MKTVFEYENYRSFLREQFPGSGLQRGRRKALADRLDCQPSFVSLVLTERAHMSEDMFLLTCDFLRVSEMETDFLLLLFHRERGASPRLRAYYDKKIAEIIKRSRIDHELKIDEELTLEQQIVYYSSWIYPAVHVATSLGKGVTLQSLCDFLDLEVFEAERATDFLLKSGLIQLQKGVFVLGGRRIHLSRQSPLAPISHTNWRLQSIRHIGKQLDHNFHYSAIYSISKKDYLKLKKQIEAQVLEYEKVIQPSKEEELCVLGIDFFKFGHGM